MDSPTFSNVSGRARQILLVDENGSWVGPASACLGAEGYSVKSAHTVTAAVAAIHAHKPDLIVMELRSPEKGAHGAGVDWKQFLVLAWAGRLDLAASIPFIAVGTDECCELALQLGAIDFVSRADGKELTVAVNRALSLVLP